MLDLKLQGAEKGDGGGIHGKMRRAEINQLEKKDAEMKRSKSKKRGKAFNDLIKKAHKEHEHKPILVR